MKGGGLFELAYALYEVGDLDTSKKVYEKHAEINGETSSVLNNLSLIYEKKRDFKKAKELIIRAKKLDKDGEIVARNYSRLVSAAKNDNPEKTKPESPKIVKSIPSFDPRNGIVKLGDKQTEIPLGSNQYQLCKKLFEIPLGDWLQETDVIDHFNRGKDSGRSFYDAIRLANQKIEDDLKVKKLLEYQASRVRVRKEGIA